MTESPSGSSPINTTNMIGGLARKHSLISFFCLAYMLGWTALLPLVLTNIGLGVIRRDIGIEWIVPATFSPTVVALWIHWFLHRNFRFVRLFPSAWRALLGLLVGVGLVVFAFSVFPAILLAEAPIRAIHWSALLAPATYAVNWSTVFGGPLGEEPGWRGFALSRMQSRFGPTRGSVLLGILWTGWHLPLFLLHGWSNVPLWAFALMLVAASILFTYAVNLSRGSALVAILLHATFNTSFGILASLCHGIPTRNPDLPYYLCAAVVTALATSLLTRGQLGVDKGFGDHEAFDRPS